MYDPCHGPSLALRRLALLFKMDKKAKYIVVIETDPIKSVGSVCLTADGRWKGWDVHKGGCICTIGYNGFNNLVMQTL
jgi:hypothetical protein